MSLVSVSNSEIQTFKKCRRKWWLEYYRLLAKPQEPRVGALAFGTRIHLVLERFYGYGEDPVSLHSELIQADRIKVEESGEDEKKFESEAELGQIMIEGYLDWLEETGADKDLEVVSTERKVEMPLLGGAATLIGKLDMRVRDLIDGSVSFLDHKTSQNFSDFTSTANMNEQLLTYTTLERHQALDGEEWAKGGTYNLLKKVKRTSKAIPPFYSRLSVKFNPTFIDNFRTRLDTVVRHMIETRLRLDAGEHHQIAAYPTPSKECSWFCPYFLACPLFDDGSDVEGYLSSTFVVSNPYERYEDLESADR